jgi:hypothetical protein
MIVKARKQGLSSHNPGCLGLGSTDKWKGDVGYSQLAPLELGVSSHHEGEILQYPLTNIYHPGCAWLVGVELGTNGPLVRLTTSTLYQNGRCS